jgi:hypothetical protein
MKNFSLITASILLSSIWQTLALAQNYGTQYLGSACGGSYSCGPEQVIGMNQRTKPYIPQPIGPSGEKGECGTAIPTSQSYKVVVNPLACGEGSATKGRYPAPVKESIMERWDELSRSGLADAQEKMQKIRQDKVKWDGELEYPVYESWSYEWIDGGYDSRCGMEPWQTTCQMSRTESYYEDVQVTDYNRCVEYYPEPEPSANTSSSSGGGSAGGSSGSSTYRPAESPFSQSAPKREKGPGESRSEIHKDLNDRFDRAEKKRNGGSHFYIKQTRWPASQCKTYGTKWEKQLRTRSAQPVQYSCMKERPRWCTWPSRSTVTKRCANQVAKYSVEFTKDPNWKPGFQYADRKMKYRDYNSVLPNKYDLLRSESEEMNVFSNLGTSRSIRPAFNIVSQWNEYKSTAVPASLSCEFQKPVEFKILVNTVGRRLTKAPKTMAIPLDDQGKEIFPLTVVNGRPTNLKVMDTGRATQLAAAANSRAFTRPEEAPQASADAVRKKINISKEENKQIQNGYWQETRFLLSLAENGRWGRAIPITIPAKFGSNQGQVFDDTFDISLIGKDALPNLYRAVGPFQNVLGWLWTSVGVQFTPGQEYVFKIQSLSRGLPFYESGCKAGTVTCEGEDGKEEFYTEPLLVKWTAPRDEDHRGFLKRFIDFQKIFKIW